MIPTQIISGGQTGADRAALDWARFHNLPHGGWCPRGRKAEDGTIPSCYDLQETKSADYIERTERNVQESDGTVIFTMKRELVGGSKRTADFAKKHGKPCLHSHPGASYQLARDLLNFVNSNGTSVLNVAGSRESKEPKIGEFVKHLLEEALSPTPPVRIGGPDEG